MFAAAHREFGIAGGEWLSGKEVFYWIDKTFLEESLESVLDYIRRNA